MNPTHLRRWLPALSVGAGPVLIAALIIGCVALTAPAENPNWPVYLRPLPPQNVRQLATTFKRYHYTWPPTSTVPPLEVRHLLTGLNALNPDRKKHLFLRAVLPLVLATNNRIRREREYVIQTLAHAGPGAWPQRLLDIAAEYDVHDSLDRPAARADLLRRCAVVPPGLVLAQAAKESGWGTSRFVVQGNNLFGVHTWNPDYGHNAAARSKHRSVLVLAYPNLRASVRDYIHNLNMGHAYVAFRELRARQKRRKRMNILALARALGSYSQLGKIYTLRLQQLIRHNGLDRLPQLKLGAPRLQL